MEQPPANDTQLNFIAGQYGCLYSGPTQITLSTDANGHGQMTVVSPDTSEGTQTVNNVQYTWDTNNITSNVNNCPNNGTAPLPNNGVVFVQNATPAQTQPWANPFDDATNNSSTNLTSAPAAPLTANKVQAVTLTAAVTSGSRHLDAGATVVFSQTTKQGQTTTSVIGSCSAQPLSTPVAVSPPTTPPTYKSTATCATTESGNSTGAFSATYSGGTSTTSSSANLGQTNSLIPSISYGPDAQVTAGGCTNCYFGQTGSPDAEGDAFVNGSLSGQLTIGTANNVIIDGNVTYADCAGTWTTGQSGSSAPSEGFCPFSPGGTNDALGLIANNYAELNRPVIAASTQGSGGPTVEPPCGATPAATCDPSDGTDGVTVDAAVLALTQAFVVNNYTDSGTEGDLTLYGSLQQFARGPVGTFNGSSITTGYQKNYTWDPLLDFVSPPSYLVPSTASWVLTSVNTDAGVGSNNTCPPLLPVYGSSQPIVQYCSASPGGLPGFPTMTAPSPPTNVTATSNSDGSVTVNWTDPQANNGSAITGYGVAPNPACSGCTYSSLVGANVTSTRVSGLTRGTWYTFSVTATNGLGTSSPSTASNSVIAPDVPSAPSNPSATTNPNGSVTVSWTDPSGNGSPITGYSIIPIPSCPGCTYTSLSGPALTSGTVSGLTRGASYTFTVTATNGVGTGPASAPSNAVTTPNLPGAPTGVTATVANGTSASVSWTAPSSNGGSPITGYVVTPYLGATPQAPQTFVSTATTETATSLTNGAAYTFTVAAINGVGTGAQSAASNPVTPATAPGAPTTVSATTNPNGSVTVTWVDPASNGSPITGYSIIPIPSCPGCTYTSLSGPAVTSGTVSGLTPGASYTFAVTATNGVGTGTASAPSNAVTAPNVPGAPTIGTATQGASGSHNASVKFTAPGSNGSAITSYTVTATDTTNGSRGGQTASGLGNPVSPMTVSGLTAGDHYTFKVTATNGVGTGAPSASSNSITAR